MGYCYYGHRKSVQAGSISGAITAVGHTIVSAPNTNPTKVVGSDKLIPQLQQMLDRFRKANPPTTKQLPVEADVPEILVKIGLGLGLEAYERDWVIGNLTMIAHLLLTLGW